MTRFRIVETPHPDRSFADLTFTDVAENSLLAESVSGVFSTPGGVVWNVRSPDCESGKLAFEAYDSSIGLVRHVREVHRVARAVPA